MTPDTTPPPRNELRSRLLKARRAWVDTPQAQQAQRALHERLMAVLAQLEPDCLGVYWPIQGEFTPMEAALSAQKAWGTRLALPFANKNPVEMHFRAWDGQAPASTDACGIPTSDGKPVVPDVVLVPCVGFTAEGWRLGYGGGYFDRFMAVHPEVTAIGLAWEQGRLDEATLAPQAHDLPLLLVLTESNSWSA